MGNRKSQKHDIPIDPGRRKLLEKMVLGGIGLTGVGALLSREERILQAEIEKEKDVAPSVDGISGATPSHTNWAKLEDLKKKPPRAKIGKLRISRIFMGGNLFNGWAHSRDLIYVSDLISAYNTPDKIQATFQLAQACGVNAFLSHYSNYDMINRYWESGGDMHYFADCRSPEETKTSIDHGASACYINGEKTDSHVAAERYDILEDHLEQVRKEGLVAGLGAHYLSTVQKVNERGIRPDFWMVSYHHTNYWSAKHPQEYDNIYCRDPEGTAAYMREIDIPWIAFKVLAAGSISADVGFRYAFEGGADFICVGMYDFQLVDDINIAVDILNQKDTLNRKRRWI